MFVFRKYDLNDKLDKLFSVFVLLKFYVYM